MTDQLNIQREETNKEKDIVIKKLTDENLSVSARLAQVEQLLCSDEDKAQLI